MNNLKQFRQSVGLTQQEVANYLNIGRSSYTKYESGTHIPDIYILDKLATLFNITIDELVGRAQPSPTKHNLPDEEFVRLLEKLQTLSPMDIKEVESYIEFKHAKKNQRPVTTNIG